MKILITHSSSFDFKNELYLPLRSSEFNSLHTFILPHETESVPFTRPLMENKEINLQIAEVSFPSTGQGIEMGWANAFNVPLICIYKEGSRYSSSIRFITDTIVEYSDKENMIVRLKSLIPKYEKI